MKAILKSKGREEYLGVIGSHLVEIRDHDQVIKSILAKTKLKLKSSYEPYLLGSSKRMVLKTFSDDALIAINTHPSEANNQCQLSIFYNNSKVPSHELLYEARKLAKHRWSVILF